MSLRDKIRSLKIRGDKSGPNANTRGQRAPAPLHFNLGIDFGTSFTKVCYRDVGAEESGVVLADGDGIEGALIPSLVGVDANGSISWGRQVDTGNGSTVRYLKMLLADNKISGALPENDRFDLRRKKAIKALSAYFLSQIIIEAKGWILGNETERTRGREISWSANVGVPVEHCNSSKFKTFREVLGVAWELVKRDLVSDTVEDAILEYEVIRGGLDLERSDCHATAEIAAAVQSFITSREAQPGVYLYFDIGGGTLDGVGFKFSRSQGRPKIDFHSGKVEPLGVEAVSHHSGITDSRKVYTGLHDDPIPDWLSGELKEFRQSIQRLVARVVMDAKPKNRDEWTQGHLMRSLPKWKRTATIVNSSKSPVPVFVGGGGAGSLWYQQVVLSTHGDHSLKNAGIPPFHLAGVPVPSDFDMRGLVDNEFSRLSISYGLSIAPGEGPEVKLPSELGNRLERPSPEPSSPRPKPIVDYMDSKDAFD